MWRGETAHGRVCRAKPIIEVTGTFVFSRFLSTFSQPGKESHTGTGTIPARVSIFPHC